MSNISVRSQSNLETELPLRKQNLNTLINLQSHHFVAFSYNNKELFSTYGYIIH